MSGVRHSAPEHSRCGVFTETPYDGGPVKTRDIVYCHHCGYHWVWEPGSGRVRGYCALCHGLTCGRRWCREHAHCHWLQQIENMEQGRPIDFQPVRAPVPAGVPASPGGVLLGRG